MGGLISQRLPLMTLAGLSNSMRPRQSLKSFGTSIVFVPISLFLPQSMLDFFFFVDAVLVLLILF
jgi:hypothetical protein